MFQFVFVFAWRWGMKTTKRQEEDEVEKTVMFELNDQEVKQGFKKDDV